MADNICYVMKVFNCNNILHNTLFTLKEQNVEGTIH